MASPQVDLTPLLRKLETHSALTSAERDVILALPFHLRLLSASSQFLPQNEVTRQCFVLLDGYAVRSKVLRDGGRQIVTVLMRGDLAGVQRALFGRADNAVEMVTKGLVAAIPATAIDELLATQPNIVRALWSETLFDGAIQREWAVNIGRRDAHGRLAHLLCELGVRLHQAGLGEREQFDLPLTQNQLADCTGLTPVHVNRVLQSLRRDGLISNELRRVTIEDWAGLARIAGFDERYLRGPGPARRTGPFELSATLQGAVDARG